MKTNKFNKEIMRKIEHNIKELFLKVEYYYTNVDDIANEKALEFVDYKDVCEDIIYTIEAIGYDVLASIENTEIIQDIESKFNCEVISKAILKDKDNFYVVAKVIPNDSETYTYYIKRLNDYALDRYITTETVIECKTKLILETQTLTTVNMIQLIALFKGVDFETAIDVIDKEYLELIFKTSTNEDILQCIPSLALNCLNGEGTEYTLSRIYMENIQDITWTSILTGLNFLTKVIDEEEDLVEAIKEAHRVAMKKSTVKYK